MINKGLPVYPETDQEPKSVTLLRGGERINSSSGAQLQVATETGACRTSAAEEPALQAREMQ